MVDGAGMGGLSNRPFVTMQNSEVGNNPNEKNSGEEYFCNRNPEEDESNPEFRSSEFVDRSAQLRATLNSLAILNVAGIINVKKNRPQSKQPHNNQSDDTDDETGDK